MTPLFDGAIADAATQYVGIPVRNGTIGLQIGWRDATSAATITLELTDTDAVTDAAGEAWEWIDSAEEFTGPVGSAAGGELVLLENVRARRARLKIVATADCDIVIYDAP